MIALDPKLSAMARDQAQTLMDEADALRREAEVLDQRALATARVWMFGLDLNRREVYAEEPQRPVCTCGVKTMDPDYHAPDCPVRL